MRYSMLHAVVGLLRIIPKGRRNNCGNVYAKTRKRDLTGINSCEVLMRSLKTPLLFGAFA